MTSYIYPADIIPNVEALASRVDDIQLVLFESADVSNLPSAETIARLREISNETSVTYSVHFPIDRKLGSESASERTGMLDQILRIVDLTAPLAPSAYNLHIEGIDRTASPERVRQWQADTGPLLARIAARIADPSRVCIENLNFPYEWCVGFLERFGFSVCMDFGHLRLYGTDWRAFAVRNLQRTRVIHFHGVHGSRDHVSLRCLDRGELRDFLDAIKFYSGILTLELFDYDDARTSIESLNECLEKPATRDA